MPDISTADCSKSAIITGSTSSRLSSESRRDRVRSWSTSRAQSMPACSCPSALDCAPGSSRESCPRRFLHLQRGQRAAQLIGGIRVKRRSRAIISCVRAKRWLSASSSRRTSVGTPWVGSVSVASGEEKGAGRSPRQIFQRFQFPAQQNNQQQKHDGQRHQPRRQLRELTASSAISLSVLPLLANHHAVFPSGEVSHRKRHSSLSSCNRPSSNPSRR